MQWTMAHDNGISLPTKGGEDAAVHAMGKEPTVENEATRGLWSKSILTKIFPKSDFDPTLILTW